MEPPLEAVRVYIKQWPKECGRQARVTCLRPHCDRQVGDCPGPDYAAVSSTPAYPLTDKPVTSTRAEYMEHPATGRPVKGIPPRMGFCFVDLNRRERARSVEAEAQRV